MLTIPSRIPLIPYRKIAVLRKNPTENPYFTVIRITKEVMHSRKLSPDLHKLVKGVMIESYIEEGNQKVGTGCYGKSITDPCLGWEDSERLIYDIAEYE